MRFYGPLLLASIAIPLSTGLPQAASDPVKAKVSAFESRFRSGAGKPAILEERNAALAALAMPDLPDDPRVAQALVDANHRCRDEFFAIGKELSDLFGKTGEILKQVSEDLHKGRAPKADVKAKLESLNRRIQELTPQSDGLARLMDTIGSDLAKMHATASVEWLLANVIGDISFERKVKVAIARNAGERSEPPPESLVTALDKALGRAKAVDEKVALLAGVASCGPAARRCAPVAIKLLADPERTVREQAAAALAQLAAPEAIAPLVKRLAAESGATRRRVANALETLTRQRCGDDAAAWNDWIAKEGAPIVKGELALPPPEPPRRTDLFGIALEGRAFVFVVDCSQWMLVDASEPRWTRKIAEMKGPSRLDVTKRNLSALLGALRADDRFAIVAFADEARPWKRRLVAAEPATVMEAQAWVAALSTAVGTKTNTHDALVAALQLTDDHAGDPFHRSPDGLFLITAGRPEAPDATPGNRKSQDVDVSIRTAVNELNPGHSIVVNAIALGAECDEKLLAELAAENGGTFLRM